MTAESHGLITGLGEAADVTTTQIPTGLIMQIDKDLVRPEKPMRLAEGENVIASAYA